jgi:hypothetical protein
MSKRTHTHTRTHSHAHNEWWSHRQLHFLEKGKEANSEQTFRQYNDNHQKTCAEIAIETLYTCILKIPQAPETVQNNTCIMNQPPAKVANRMPAFIICQKNQGTVKSKQKPVTMCDRTTHRTLSPERTPLQMELTNSLTCERCLEKDETATHILCDGEAIAYLRFRHLGH